MKIISSFGIFLSFLWIFSCNSFKINKNEFTPTYLSGYFSKNTIAYNSKEIIPVILTNKNNFNLYFGQGKTSNNTISPINFKDINIAALITKPDSIQKSIQISSFFKNGSSLTVEYEIILGNKQTYFSNAVKIFEINKEITEIIFISNTISEKIKI